MARLQLRNIVATVLLISMLGAGQWITPAHAASIELEYRAVQAVAGPSINARLLLYPVMNATGSAAIKDIALLKFTANAFAFAQNHPVQMMDAIQRYLRPYAGDSERVYKIEALNEQTHFLDLSSLSPQAQANVITHILTRPFASSYLLVSSGLTADDTKLNPGTPLTVGATAPIFNLATAIGKHYSLSLLRGHPVLLEFFAVWGTHCQMEAPILNNIDKAYASKGLQSLSILSSPYDRTHDATGSTNPVTKDDITWFKNTFNVAHPILIDPNFSTVNQYGVQAYPTIYILDKNGVIHYSNIGDVPYQTLAHGVDAALKR